MIKEVFQKLDYWIERENQERREMGTLLLKKVKIQIVGQTALLEAKLNLSLLGTADVDAFIQGEYVVREKLNELLKNDGHFLDPDSEKIWMPDETKYHLIYDGTWVGGFLADPESVLLSKALKAPHKNKNLMIEYLANKPSDRFLKLAKKYHLNLENFL